MMKKQGWCVLLALALLFSASASVTAVPGSPENPVITLRYLEDIYLPSIRQKASLAVENQLDGVYNEVARLLGGSGLPVNEAALARKVMSRLNFKAVSQGTARLEAGSVLTVGLGSSVQLVSGTASHRGGTLTDVTLGQDTAATAALAANHRYVSLSDEASVRITADAAVLITGSYRITPPYVPMYTDLCEALMMMDIINTYGLERDATRMEMFIVFVSILGVKVEAYSYTGAHPFTDVVWGHEYVAYLFDNGHTAGTGNGMFSPNMTGTVQQLCFIMLKALGYRDLVDISFATAVADAVRLGLFSQREIDILLSEDFTRDTLIYMTYYSLFAEYKDTGERVIDRLVSNGQVPAGTPARAFASVKRTRF